MNATLSREEFGRLQEVVGAVELLEVRPVGFLARVVGTPPSTSTPVALNLRNEVSARSEGEGAFAVHANLILGVRVDAAGSGEFLKVRYEAIARYRLGKGAFSQEHFDLFARSNGMLHLWPYFRAFVASACGQLGLAPITLPTFPIQSPKGK